MMECARKKSRERERECERDGRREGVKRVENENTRWREEAGGRVRVD